MKKEPMIRKQLYIERAQDEFVKELAAEYSVSEAEIVRTAIDGLSRGRQFALEEIDLNSWEEEVRFIRSRFGSKAEKAKTVKSWTRDEIHER